MISVSTYTAILNQLLPEPHAGLLNGILFGTKAALSRELYDALVATGTLHIVALSGMNITILESIIAKSLGYVLNKRVTSILTILLIIGFIWFVGLSPSVIRAGIMGSMALIAVVFGRQKWSIFFFTATCAVMLLMHPAWALDLSFQLSAGATLGIILFGPRVQKNIVVDTLWVTLAAQIFTIPLILFTFRRISLISPLTNVLIGWIIQPLTAIGFIVAILGWIWLPLGQIFAWAAWVGLEYLIVAVEITAKMPFSSLTF
jgi:competence protein ComEC